MCVDMRCANKAVCRERHVTPTVDDILTALNEATVFSKLDLKEGYHQLELHEDSRPVTTFSTHAGLFRYKRLNFGINSAAEVFQNTIRQVLGGIPNVLNVSDDILVYGTTKEDHDKALEATLERLSKGGLTLNPKKCSFFQKQLTFFGHVFSSAGVQPDPMKVSALQNAVPPTSANEVRSLLGMFNYCGRFLPNLANLTQPLRQLTIKGTPWTWTSVEQRAFDELKGMLSNSTTLAYFDPEKSTDLIVDAAPHGLGAILAQSSAAGTKVVAYGSRALTAVEARYSQIEREMLAVVWGMEHFQIYLFGTSFRVLTDHKPLVNILSNPRSSPSARMERLALRLQPYSFDVAHTKGSTNPSDYLSRHPPQTPPDKKDKLRTLVKMSEAYVACMIQHSLPCAMTLENVLKETKADPQLTKVTKALQLPQLDKNAWKDELRPFSRVMSELSMSREGLMVRGTRIVLPANLQHKAVHLAHKGRQRIVKTKQLLRSKVWFPGIDKLVDSIVKSCIACQAATPEHHRDPLPASKLPECP